MKIKRLVLTVRREVVVPAGYVFTGHKDLKTAFEATTENLLRKHGVHWFLPEDAEVFESTGDERDV